MCNRFDLVTLFGLLGVLESVKGTSNDSFGVLLVVSHLDLNLR